MNISWAVYTHETLLHRINIFHNIYIQTKKKTVLHITILRTVIICNFIRFYGDILSTDYVLDFVSSLIRSNVTLLLP